jgi:peptidoglycan lytic transglycosylase G
VVKRLFLLLLLLVVAAGGAGWWARQRLTTPFKGFPDAEVFVDLPPGSSVSTIANRLVASGVLPDALTFRLAARYTGADRRLQAGEYRFTGPSTPLAVIDRLAAGDVFIRPLTIPEGFTIFEVADAFAKRGLGTASEFLAAARDPSIIERYDARARSLEGYLFPDTYALPRSADADDLVHAMLARFDTVLDASLRASIAERGMTVREALTLASLVEKETGRREERPIIAAVYRNRLALGMPLQCDPTVIYALMLAGRWNGNIRKVDLELDSPYNTYKVRGLPPGPIASPGRASIDAVMHPADVKYLYFVSRNDGSHVFATTLAEHNRNVARWQRR